MCTYSLAELYSGRPSRDSHRRSVRRTSCCNNTALCVASRGNKTKQFTTAILISSSRSLYTTDKLQLSLLRPAGPPQTSERHAVVSRLQLLRGQFNFFTAKKALSGSLVFLIVIICTLYDFIINI